MGGVIVKKIDEVLVSVARCHTEVKIFPRLSLGIHSKLFSHFSFGYGNIESNQVNAFFTGQYSLSYESVQNVVSQI